MAKKKANPGRRPAKAGSTKRLPTLPKEKSARAPRSPARVPDQLKAARKALDKTARRLDKARAESARAAKAKQKATRKAIATARKTFDRFRDKITGKLVSALRAKRSAAQGGTRYKKERASRTSPRGPNSAPQGRKATPAPAPKPAPKKTAPRKRSPGRTPPKSEYWIKAQTGNRKNRNTVNFEAKLTGPKGASDERAIDALQQIYEGDEVKGWKIDVIQWQHPGESKWRTDENTATQYAFFNESASVRKG